MREQLSLRGLLLEEVCGAAGPRASTLVPLETQHICFSCLHTEDAPALISSGPKVDKAPVLHPLWYNEEWTDG